MLKRILLNKLWERWQVLISLPDKVTAVNDERTFLDWRAGPPRTISAPYNQRDQPHSSRFGEAQWFRAGRAGPAVNMAKGHWVSGRNWNAESIGSDAQRAWADDGACAWHRIQMWRIRKPCSNSRKPLSRCCTQLEGVTRVAKTERNFRWWKQDRTWNTSLVFDGRSGQTWTRRPSRSDVSVSSRCSCISNSWR